MFSNPPTTTVGPSPALSRIARSFCRFSSLNGAIGERLGRSVPHYLPPFYEEVGRAFLDAGLPDLGLQCVTGPGRVIAHWMDAFGAAYSIPHGTGVISGDTLRFSFNYASGPFRDTFVFDRAAGTWSFLLESGDGKGGWRTFAAYDVRRAPR